MPYAVYLNGELVAYLNSEKNTYVVERARATLLENCLAAYGVRVELGVDTSINYPRRMDGFPLKPATPDMDESKLALAVGVCVSFVSGLKPSVEKVEELYELKLKKPKREELEGEEGEEVELEVS